MKYILSILFSLVCYCSFGQNTFPNVTTQGSNNTIVLSKGGLGSDSMIYVKGSYPDTTTANFSKNANYLGSLIRVGNTLWIRGASIGTTPNKWYELSNSTSGGTVQQITLSTGLVAIPNPITITGTITADTSVLSTKLNVLNQLNKFTGTTNITTVGTLSNLTVTGLVSSALLSGTLNHSLTPGYALVGSPYDNSADRTFSVDTSLLATPFDKQQFVYTNNVATGFDSAYNSTVQSRSSILSLYNGGSNILNAPGNSPFGIAISSKYDVGYGFQIGNISTDPNNLYYRSRVSSSYNSWYRFWSSNNLDTASMLSNYPTGLGTAGFVPNYNTSKTLITSKIYTNGLNIKVGGNFGTRGLLMVKYDSSLVTASGGEHSFGTFQNYSSSSSVLPNYALGSIDTQDTLYGTGRWDHAHSVQARTVVNLTSPGRIVDPFSGFFDNRTINGTGHVGFSTAIESFDVVGTGTVDTTALWYHHDNVSKGSLKNYGIYWPNVTAPSVMGGQLQLPSVVASGQMTATTFNGALNGNATTATSATSATNATNTTNIAIADNTSNATRYLTWVTGNTGNLPMQVSSTKLTYNPGTGKLATTLSNGPVVSIENLGSGSAQIAASSGDIGFSVVTGQAIDFNVNGSQIGSIAASAATFNYLGTAGVTAVAGTLTATSDSRLKTDMGLFKGSALNAISKIPVGHYWYYNEKSKLPLAAQKVKMFSVFADKVYDVLGEEFAPTQKDGYHSLADRALLSLTIQALQEANNKIDKLEQRLAKLEESLMKK